MASANYYIPAVGTKGKFEFKTPFDSILYTNQEYEVKSIRSLKEIYDSEEDPYTNIYQQVNLSEQDFQADLEDNVPIIVLSNNAGQYYYVPASKLASLPNLSGVRFQERMMVINLGYIPTDLNVLVAENTIKEEIKNKLGIISTVEMIKTSAIQYVSEDDYKAYLAKLEVNKSKDDQESYKVKYLKLSEKYTDLQAKMEELHDCFEQHIMKGLPVT